MYGYLLGHHAGVHLEELVKKFSKSLPSPNKILPNHCSDILTSELKVLEISSVILL